jgi:hypothetical protein
MAPYWRLEFGVGVYISGQFVGPWINFLNQLFTPDEAHIIQSAVDAVSPTANFVAVTNTKIDVIVRTKP